MKINDYTYEMVSAALENSGTIKEFIQNLGMRVNNANYPRAKAIVKQYGLELPKYERNVLIDALREINKLPDEEYFAEGILRNGPTTKKRLINDHGYDEACGMFDCEVNATWKDKPLSLQVDHIDGDSFNNKIENLRLICPNCHSQTETYGNSRGKTVYNYCICGVKITKKASACLKHKNSPQPTTIGFPPIDSIVETVKLHRNWSETTRILGIGQNTLRKHLVRNGIDPKSILKE